MGRAAPPPVPFIGLTGAVAAGKSEALAAFGRLGAETLSSDAIVHELLASEEVASALARRWGDEVAPGGSVDRARVGAIVFERPDELAWLEAHLHPLVGDRVSAWRRSLPASARHRGRGGPAALRDGDGWRLRRHRLRGGAR